MLFKKRIGLRRVLRRECFFYAELCGAILFCFLFLNMALADVNTAGNSNDNINNNMAVKISSTNEESLAVVLTPDNIQPAENTDEIMDDAKEVPQDKSQNDRKSDTKSDEALNANEKESIDVNQNKDEQSRIVSTPVVIQDDFSQTLPQVINQTQHIGTPQQPTIDGGLISAPELVGVLSATAENIDSLSSFNEMLANLNQIYFLWEAFLHYDLNPYDLQQGLSRLKLTRENYKEKVWIKCAQILAYWTTPRTQHSSHRAHAAVKASSSRRQLPKGVRLAQMRVTEQPDFKGEYDGNT